MRWNNPAAEIPNQYVYYQNVNTYYTKIKKERISIERYLLHENKARKKRQYWIVKKKHKRFLCFFLNEQLENSSWYKKRFVIDLTSRVRMHTGQACSLHHLSIDIGFSLQTSHVDEMIKFYLQRIMLCWHKFDRLGLLVQPWDGVFQITHKHGVHE